ncbi:MAG TPA: OmpA family protein [Pseudomonas sp.]|nr:OmpA family protein [Pseudomonas sp.]
MFTPSRLIVAVTLAALMTGCATQNPDGSQNTGGVSNTVKYGGLGALAGAVAGAAINHDNRGKGAAIGAVTAGAIGAGYGYYADKQEAELRRSMEGTGVQVERQGDTIQLIMPGNITFATDSADIASSFYTPLNNLASSFKQYNQNSIEIVGHTDSTGSHEYNMGLSQRRAQSVANYLQAQGVDSTRLSTRGAGPDQPVASNASADGRAQNRRVEVTLRPLPTQQ